MNQPDHPDHRGPAGRLAVLRIDRVAHIGSLDRADKGRHSYEGHGLSVSVDPHEWEAIARLGGLPWHLLSRTEGRFVDYWSLSTRSRRGIARWGLQRNYLQRRIAWSASRWDDELEDTFTTCHDTKQEALEELEVDDQEGEVRRTTVLAGTAHLERRTEMSSPQDGFDLALVCYVEDHHPDLDGVWWQDRHGPLSAPRGVILPARLAQWTVAPLRPGGGGRGARARRSAAPTRNRRCTPNNARAPPARSTVRDPIELAARQQRLATPRAEVGPCRPRKPHPVTPHDRPGGRQPNTTPARRRRRCRPSRRGGPSSSTSSSRLPGSPSDPQLKAAGGIAKATTRR
jgi:hypothetical protein